MLGPPPWIIRSGSPSEDTNKTSNAGQFLSLPVHGASELSNALGRVAAALPVDGAGRRLGVVFIQPLVQASEAGVAFFDGFYFERTVMRGGNELLTSGHERGQVVRGHIARDDPWSQFLTQAFAAFREDRRIDIEFARDDAGYVLLQSRPALFPIQRNPILSLSNHKEILGDLPSPWITSAMVTAGRDLSFMAHADRAILEWEEEYAVEAAERGWVNVSFWLRWMDHFGLPRSMFTDGFGGIENRQADKRINWRRFAPAVPRLFWFQGICLVTISQLKQAFQRYDAALRQARSLSDLHRQTVRGLELALRANFAINAALSGWIKVRRFLRVPGSTRVVTRTMMEEYARLATLPDEHRDAGLDEWLRRYGHRGPFESDLSRPRFAELRDVLRQDLASLLPTDTPTESGPGIWRPFFWVDERREWFRNELMKRWQRIRSAILIEARRLADQGLIDRDDDVFWLRGDDLTNGQALRQAINANRGRHEAVRGIPVPDTATRDRIHETIALATAKRATAAGERVFFGIALSAAVREGIVRKADDLVGLLRQGGFTQDTILCVPTLEPSWAVVFPRVGGVVTEMGGELSHASILLREIGKPAIVNCAGIYAAAVTGDRVRLDGRRGMVEILNR
jgi:pyruvate,water dikinase